MWRVILLAAACAAVSAVDASNIFAANYHEPVGASTATDTGHIYYKLRMNAVTAGSAPTISMVKLRSGDGSVLNAERVSCSAINEAYCNGALLGAGPASWNTNCRNLGVKLNGADKNKLEWKLASAAVVTDVQFWLSGNECQGGTFQLLFADNIAGPWTVMKEFKLEQCACRNQWTNIHVQDFSHCLISAKDWTTWGNCDTQCGGGMQHRKIKSITTYPSGGGRGCESQFAAMSRQCNRHACPCPKGAFHNPVNCMQCPAGKYQPNKGKTVCLACPAGKYASSFGLATCTACAAGTASSMHGRTTACPHCDAGYFSAHAASSTCHACAPGHFSDLKRATSCQSCDQGTYASGGANTDCKLCKAGQFQRNTASSHCNACSKGYYLRKLGAISSSSCSRCAPGQWSDTPSASCVKCNAGTYSSQGGASLKSCIPCTIGTYSQAGASQCSPCDPGTYSSAQGMPCVNCPQGTHNPLLGATNLKACKACRAGTYSSTRAAECTMCSAGTYSVSSNGGPNSCLGCAAGQYASMGSTKCSSCAVGRYAAARSGICTKCAAGRYGTAAEAETERECLPCLAGQFQMEAGQSRCYDCGRGRYQTATAQKDCIDCAAGTYSARTGSRDPGYKSCVDCAAGMYQDAPGQGECKRCAGGGNGVIGARSAKRCDRCHGPLCPVDCIPEKWSNQPWSQCSHTCGSRGLQTRSRAVNTAAAHGGNECSHNPGSSYSLIETRPCNRQTKCPVDCVASPWGPWSQCSQKCASSDGQVGYTERVAVAIGPTDGGKPCTQSQLKQKATCNTHRCLSAGECHAQHVKCRIVDESTAKQRMHVFAPESHGSRTHKTADATVVHPWAVNCMNEVTNPLSAMRHHDVPSDPRCNPNFCQVHNNCKRLEIEHFKFKGSKNSFAMGFDRRATHLNPIDRSAFKCSKTGANTCKCYCTKHRRCCTKQGKRIKGNDLLGNTFHNVESAQGCCNLCTSHPQCQGWNYHSMTGVCTLKDGTVFESGSDDEIAGHRYSEVSTC